MRRLLKPYCFSPSTKISFIYNTLHDIITVVHYGNWAMLGFIHTFTWQYGVFGSQNVTSIKLYYL